MNPLVSSIGDSSNNSVESSVRIIVLDHYLSRVHSQFLFDQSFLLANPPIQVPVLRVFGSTPDGVHTCLHIHNVFPYIYIPNIYIGLMPSNFQSVCNANVSIVDIIHSPDMFSVQFRSLLTELAHSIDEALTLSIDQENPKFAGNFKQSIKRVTSHVFSIVPVTARFFTDFFRIFFDCNQLNTPHINFKFYILIGHSTATTRKSSTSSKCISAIPCI